jgi:putative ABC transport system permease protein
MPVTEIKSSPEERRSLDKQFGAVVNLLMVLAFLTAMVSGIGLVGTLSIDVIERTKEIGVMRTIGARSGTIMSMFVLEALVQALLSWVIALPISLVGAPLLSNALGRIMLGTDLEYQYNYPAALVWLVLILIIGLLASILPARSASQISVRQSLAYE